MQEQFAELAAIDIDDEPAHIEDAIMKDIGLPAGMIAISREDFYGVCREVMSELMYEMAEIIMKPELAKNDPFRPLPAERKQFSEHDTVIYSLKCHYGHGIFKPFDKGSNACKVTKVNKHELQKALQRAAAEGKAECVDANGLRMEWRML